MSGNLTAVRKLTKGQGSIREMYGKDLVTDNCLLLTTLVFLSVNGYMLIILLYTVVHKNQDVT